MLTLTVEDFRLDSGHPLSLGRTSAILCSVKWPFKFGRLSDKSAPHRTDFGFDEHTVVMITEVENWTAERGNAVVPGVELNASSFSWLSLEERQKVDFPTENKVCNLA